MRATSALVLAENRPTLAVFRGFGEVHVRARITEVVALAMAYHAKASLTRSRTRFARPRGATSTPGVLWSTPDPPLAKWDPWSGRLRLSQPAWR